MATIFLRKEDNDYNMYVCNCNNLFIYHSNQLLVIQLLDKNVIITYVPMENSNEMSLITLLS